MLDFTLLAQQCAPAVHPTTMAAVIRVESTFNPLAIGIVGGHLERQPLNETEAVVTAKALASAGYNFSLGIGQVNRYNLARYGLDYHRAFDPCANLNAASLILRDCFARAKANGLREERALQAAFSCYYSGNLTDGFRSGPQGRPSYVRKILDSALTLASAKRLSPIRIVRTDPHQDFAESGDNRVQTIAAASRPMPRIASASAPIEDAVMVYR